MSDLGPDSRPRLPRGVRLRHDAVRAQWMLLAPERVLHLDPVAAEILKRCDGERSFAALVDDLALAFKADRATIEADVRTMLTGLADKKVLDL